MQQPVTRKEWLAKRNQPDLRVVRRNSRGYREPHRKSSIELGQDALAIQRQINMIECELCCESYRHPHDFLTLYNCRHQYCKRCVLRHTTICITEGRIEVPCPGCSEDIHPSDIKIITDDDRILYEKYEMFSVRRVLMTMDDMRFCPAPDCGFAVIVPNGSRCPRISCYNPRCQEEFCFDCKQFWHQGKACVEFSPNDPTSCRPCPRCQTLIMKANDGSCNHMTCTMCRAEFCWLCLKEITDFHYMSPTGCTFWGKKPWSAKRKLMWQIGTLIGTPAVVVATAVVSVPLIMGLVPYSIGKKVYRKMKSESKAKRAISTAAAVTGSAIVSPVVAGVAVVLGVPLAIGYTYIMVPKALIHDVTDMMNKKKQPEIMEITAGELLKLSMDESEELCKKPSTIVTSSETSEYRNADGSAPGPSSVTSSDYSEDFDSTDFVELTTDSDSF
ncbi:hypothetical protein L3Y34_019265 [Caenorhabditis briggsae]|uniref:RBR-type E3 ubiquitin transferase n=3 Tax=Caenorhabditis briggsae TaxID=6238 RepID=A0AAE9DNK5_CAEBR|nr:hypothetical protein L3Y34_019265 [Caenorhabditis briggsae]